MADIIDEKILRSKTESINALPTLPSTLRQISLMLEKPKVTLDELGRFVSNDPALTTKILKMVNSAAFGFPGRISSVSHAIMLLGVNVVKGLLLGVSVFELMQKTMAGLWEHSLGCAAAARVIAQKINLKDPEEVSICGLLHDIGKALLLLQFPQEYEQAMREAEQRGNALYDTETNYFAATHAEVGYWLAQKWHFPSNLVEAIGYHHRPQISRQSPMETAIVHVSDVLVRARGVGFAGDPFVPAVHPATWEKLKLSKEDIKDIFAQLDDAADSNEGIS
jgi:putative nucleotidyltransferase with HDIG domain